MRRCRSTDIRSGALTVFIQAAALLLALLALPQNAGAFELTTMRKVVSDALMPPSERASGIRVALPDADRANSSAGPLGPAWYSAEFEVPASTRPGESWSVYLPYLYDGGQIWLNGIRVGEVQEGTDVLRVRWERAHLFTLPPGLLREGENKLDIRVAAAPARTVRRFPVVSVAPLPELLARYDRRQFWVRTAPQITAVVCLLMAAIVLFIWWRRRSEVLYGLFGCASALWGLRTLTFVIESMPSDHWHLWRMVYLGATGGFIVVLALFALRFSAIQNRWARRGLLAYWAAGPAWLLVAGPQHESFVNQWWTMGLIPIGLGIMVVSFRGIVQQRTLESSVMPAALVVAVLAGIHDYMVSWDVGPLATYLPGWAAKRIFVLHHGANLLLLCMGALLTARFIRTNDSLEDLNLTLERRIADREQHLAANYDRMAGLQRQHAASQERQAIMREIHDGLGSRLFTSLSRVERGDMNEAQIAGVLRECIADMRIALDALSSDAHDFQTALGNFLFRWQAQLEEGGIRPHWTIDVADDAGMLSPQASLQLLRIAQEALTNVLKHSRASRVEVTLRQTPDALELEIVDNGVGHRSPVGAQAGRGIFNMQARARKLGAGLELLWGPDGTSVFLRVPAPARLA